MLAWREANRKMSRDRVKPRIISLLFVLIPLLRHPSVLWNTAVHIETERDDNGLFTWRTRNASITIIEQ